MKTGDNACRLCAAPGCVLVGERGGRHFVHCPVCDLVFVPVQDHISVGDELSRYALHTNSESDTGYVTFLTEVAAAVERLALTDPYVLDFGSGPAQVLTHILRAQGVRCDAYDPLYGIGLGTPRHGQYDVIVVCEVLEHLRDLPAELLRINALAAPSGRIVVRTGIRPADPARFLEWWYAQDITHVNFVSRCSCDWIAAALGRMVVEYDGESLIVMAAEV